MINSNLSDEHQLAYKEFLQREYSTSHLAFENEFNFYNAVKSGNEAEVRKRMLPLSHEELGHLSDNVVRNMKYHTIIAIALITRFCIEGGMPSEDAYTLSDLYIQKLDILSTVEEVTELHDRAIMGFTHKMKSIHTSQNFSRYVTLAMDYIYDHLNEKISLEEMARHLALNKTYLCGIFKKETSLTIGEYIQQKKIEAAKNMLCYSDYSSVEIGNYLGFSSHSRFITVFKEHEHMTPKKYRDAYYHSWHH